MTHYAAWPLITKIKKYNNTYRNILTNALSKKPPNCASESALNSRHRKAPVVLLIDVKPQRTNINTTQW